MRLGKKPRPYIGYKLINPDAEPHLWQRRQHRFNLGSDQRLAEVRYARIQKLYEENCRARGENTWSPAALSFAEQIASGKGTVEYSPGEYPTHTSRDGHSRWDVTMANEDRHVEVKDFEMVPGGHLARTVVDSVSGEVVPDLELRLVLEPVEKAPYLRYATTDEKGRFTEEALFPGTYEVQVNGARYKVLGIVKIEPEKRVERQFVVAAKERPESTKD